MQSSWIVDESRTLAYCISNVGTRMILKVLEHTNDTAGSQVVLHFHPLLMGQQQQEFVLLANRQYPKLL
jgi:hypothetical protein